jgi:hypothetical protein
MDLGAGGVGRQTAVVAGERSGDRVVKQTMEYAPRRLMDIYTGPHARLAVLLWHGRGPDERAVAVVCLAAGFSRPGVLTAESPLALAGSALTGPPPLYLVHGTVDTVVSVAEPRNFVAALKTVGHSARLLECPSDHAGVVMTEYDCAAGHCRPTTAQHAVQAGHLAAGVLLEAAGSSGPLVT